MASRREAPPPFPIVEQHDVGLRRQRPRNRRPLFLAARKMGWEIVVLVVKTDLIVQKQCNEIAKWLFDK